MATLAHTVRTQILIPLHRLNSWSYPVPSVSFGVVTEEEADLTGDLLRSLHDAGLEPGQIAPLADGQDLEIAGRHYKVTVS